MEWGPNTDEQTRAFIQMAISKAEETPCTNHQYAAVLKETGRLIGACNLLITGDRAEIGWILHRDYWKLGLGPEMGRAMLQLGFEELKLHRITARCDAENHGSYRVMEKIGMRREGLFLQARPVNKLSDKKYGDELVYAILKEEWDTQKEIEYYNALPLNFDGFFDLAKLEGGEIYLVCTAKKPAVPEKKYVPAYEFAVCKGGEKIGDICLRLGYTEGLYYGGQIGYGIDEKYRGNGYAALACRLLVPVMKAHGMRKVLITNSQTNTVSRRVCEKLGARLLRVARLPEWHDLYKEGNRFENIFEWSVED
jgi:RimJ/RimL family protein N-acetyltransferase